MRRLLEESFEIGTYDLFLFYLSFGIFHYFYLPTNELMQISLSKLFFIISSQYVRRFEQTLIKF